MPYQMGRVPNGLGRAKGRVDHAQLGLRRCQKFVSVAEDWYPTTNGLVCVSLYGNAFRGYLVVTVEGGDDYGMQRFFEAHEEQRATRLFYRINHLVTKDQLSSWGLEHY